jgi:hypothetical protein
MEQYEFDKRFSKLQVKLKSGNDSYQFKSVDDVWANIGSASLDRFYTELAELYLASNDAQRLMIYTYCGQQYNLIENFWYFIRRIGKLIHSKDDYRWLEIGVASALMDGKRSDYRDLYASLVLLRYASERQGINTKSIFDTFIPSSQEKIKPFLENVRDLGELSVQRIVRDFGPPDWVAESVKLYGEQNLYK